MKQKAFTLIELLVVISIIALLASIVLAALNTARDKGRIGAGRYLASEIEHIAGDSLVGAWDYDECATNPTYDRSGYGNNGVLNSAASYSTDTQSGKGCSIYFDGTNGMSYAGGSTNVPAYQFGMNSITVAGWINPTAPACCGAYNSIFSSWGSTVRIGVGIYNGISLSYIFKDSSNNQIAAVGTEQIPLNKWTFIAMTADRTANRLNIYVDGKPSSLFNIDMSTIVADMNLNGAAQTGTSWGGTSAYLNGKVDSVRVYTKALTGSDIGKMYAAGLPAHSFAIKNEK